MIIVIMAVLRGNISNKSNKNKSKDSSSVRRCKRSWTSSRPVLCNFGKLNWVAVKELKSGYYSKEILPFTIWPY